MFAIRREQGRLAEVAPVLSMLSGRSGPEMGVWRPGLAALHAELDMLDDAREVFAQVAAAGFETLARDSLWPAAVSFLADAVTAIGDTEHAALVYGELLMWRDRNLMVGMTVCFGPADRYLGNLAALLGHLDDAEAHYAAAHALAARSGSPVWEAHALHDHARFLAATGRDVEAAPRFAAAHAIALDLGMAALASRTDPEKVAHPAPASDLPDGLSAREVEVLRLVAHGSSNREIGEALHISQNTVANHVRAILQKTGCANRTEAAAYAARRQLLDA
jgi:DNA-binding CsgD family transcriptional regulator